MELEDPLGFTRQTAVILQGIGASSLTPECKRRNISIQTLHELTVEDWIRLGANAEQAEDMRKALRVIKRRTNNQALDLQERIEEFLEIIRGSSQQLCLNRALSAYCRSRLSKEQINFFVEPEKCLCAADILPLAANAALAEALELETILGQMDELIFKVKGESPKSDWRYLALLGSLLLSGLAMHRLCFK